MQYASFDFWHQVMTKLVLDHRQAKSILCAHWPKYRSPDISCVIHCYCSQWMQSSMTSTARQKLHEALNETGSLGGNKFDRKLPSLVNLIRTMCFQLNKLCILLLMPTLWLFKRGGLNLSSFMTFQWGWDDYPPWKKEQNPDAMMKIMHDNHCVLIKRLPPLATIDVSISNTKN